MLIRSRVFLVCALISVRSKPAAPAQPRNQRPRPRRRSRGRPISSSSPCPSPEAATRHELRQVAVNRRDVFVFTRSNSAGGPPARPPRPSSWSSARKGVHQEIGRQPAWSRAHGARGQGRQHQAVDKGSDMVVVRILEVYGRRKESSDEESWESSRRRCRIVVSASHHVTRTRREHLHLRRLRQLSRRQYFKAGDWIKSWGEQGTRQGQFNTPHTIAIDRTIASTSPIAPIAASRSSIPRGGSCGCSPSTWRCRPAPGR